MLKIIIADDETIIREGLKTSIQWEALNAELVGCACNGEQVLDIMAEQEPDICLIDICMPKIQGLELIERIKNSYPNAICIIVTGHDEFEYAHEAIKLKVFDYILKPIKEDRLNETLQKAGQVIKERLKVKEQLNRANEILKNNLGLLRDRFLNALISGKLSKDEISGQLILNEMLIENTPVLAIMEMSIKRIDTELMWNERQLVGKDFAQKEVFENELKKTFEQVYTSIDSCGNIFALIGVEDNQDWVPDMQFVEKNLGLLCEFDVRIRSERISDGLENVHLNYHSMLQEMNKKYSDIVQTAADYIAGNYWDNDLSFQQIAEKLCVSVSYLSKQFKKEVGMTFVEYLTKVRIKRAAELLKNIDLRVGEVSDMVGYSTQHYFCVVFKRIMGLSPLNYREQSLTHDQF